MLRNFIGGKMMNIDRAQVLPHSDEMEMACLGSVLVNGNEMFREVKSVLKPHHFYQEKHQIIFKEMNNLFSKNDPINTVTLIENLKNNELIKKCDGSYYRAIRI